MKALPTGIGGAVLVEPDIHRDERGFFIESFRADRAAELGIGTGFVQDNHSRSSRGVLRGMHFAVGRGQAKLVRCARGRILDVIVDLRPGSPTFTRWQAFRLDDENLRSLFVPVGLAHGFCVLSDEADVVYRCSEYYDPASERTLAHDDPEIGIEWPAAGGFTVSPRDAAAPRLAELRPELNFGP